MMLRFALAIVPLLLAGCGNGPGNSSAPAAPVVAVSAPAGQSWTDTVSKTDEGYVVGNPNAAVKLVEYGARLCPACKQFANTGFEPLMKNYVATGKVSFEFRDFLIHGPGELGLAMLARCTPKEAFFPILEQTYQNQDAMNDKMMAVSPAQQQALQGKSPVAAVTAWTEAIGGIDFMKQRGLPDAAARQCLNDQQTMTAIAAVTDKRGADGTVSGTPTLLVNGDKVASTQWADVEKALKDAGA